MNIKIDRSAYQQAEQRVREISTRLFEQSPTSFVFCSRIYRNGKYVGLYSNVNCLNDFIENFQHCLLPLGFINNSQQIKCYLSKQVHNPEATKTVGKYDINNVLTIEIPFDNYTMKFGFGLNTSVINAKNFYKNHMNYLAAFIEYFCKKAKPLFADNRLLINFSEPLSTFQSEQTIIDDCNFFNLPADTFAAIRKTSTKIEDLCTNEIELLCCLCQGLKRKDIMKRLNLSNTTLGYKISNLKGKVNCTDRGELISFALSRGIIDNFLFDYRTSGIVFDKDVRTISNKLSDQELKCFILLILGKTIYHTSDILNTSTSSIATYINRLKLKLKCSTKSDIFCYAFTQNILQISAEYFSSN